MDQLLRYFMIIASHGYYLQLITTWHSMIILDQLEAIIHFHIEINSDSLIDQRELHGSLDNDQSIVFIYAVVGKMQSGIFLWHNSISLYSNSLDTEQLEEGSDGSSEDEESRRKKISEMFNSYTKVPSPDNSDDEVDPLDSFMAQIEVSRSCELQMDDMQ